jgi:hypothetical protein
METGTLDAEPPADLLRRLAREGATGCLRIDHGDAQATVWFRGGSVYTASAPGARARLGDRLVGAGHITEEQLGATLQRQQDLPERRRIGELLIDGGLIDRETMAAYVREQIADSVTVALGWTTGSFDFAAGEEMSEDVPLDVSVENLLMEGARRLDEWEVVQRRIGSLDAVVDFVPGGGTAELSLTPDEWSMLTRIDGGSSIREIAEESGYGEFDAARIIYGLLTAGVVTLLEDEDEDDEPEAHEPEAHASEAQDQRDPGADLAWATPNESPGGSPGSEPDAADLAWSTPQAQPAEPAAEELSSWLSELDEGPAAPGAEPEPGSDDPWAPTPEAERAPEPGRPPEPERGPAPQPAAEVDRNELLREFAALDDDWSVPPAPDPAPSERDTAPPPRPTRPVPPPQDDKPKRGLFGRRRRD